MNSKNIYSEHIFLFPFTWEVFKGHNGNKSFASRTNIEYIKKVFSSDWEMQIFKVNQHVRYNEYIYFFPPVRNALYNTKQKNEVVYNFEYKNVEKGVSQYIIEVNKTQYTLQIEAIKLRIYKTGIGILSFHLYNDTYGDPEQILQINNFGRRVYPPYLPLESVKNQVIAEKLLLRINENLIIEENFVKPYDKYPIQISQTIMALLGHHFTTIPDQLKRGDIYIQPVIDDRMFTICWYIHPQLTNELCSKNSDGCYGYENNIFWYRYLFVDGKGVSCKNDSMVTKLLQRHTYDRWVDEHILYGVTRHSFVGIASENSTTHRIYDQLVCLALVQRASALHFSNEVSRIATLSKIELVIGIRSLYEYHILFVNHLYFREVTADNQGIELYERLIDQMKILSDINMLDGEIEEINEYATLIAHESTQRRTNAITIIGAALVIPTFVTGFFGMNVLQNKLNRWWEHTEFKLWLNAYVLLPVLATIFLCMIRPKGTLRYMLLIMGIGAVLFISAYIAYQYGCGL